MLMLFTNGWIVLENVPCNRCCSVGTVDKVEGVPQHSLWHLGQFQPFPTRVRRRRQQERRQVRARRVRRLDGALGMVMVGVGLSITNYDILARLLQIFHPVL